MIQHATVAPGVERVAALTPTLQPATHTNSYALGDREVLLVEPATPYEDEQREWLSWARGLVTQGRTIVAVLATHHHADHVGGAALFTRELGVPLWGHARLAGFVEAPLGRALADGDEIALAGPAPTRWRVLHTPGHASDHVCLLDAEHGTLIVGDMVASVGTILIAPGDGDMTEYVAQLGRLGALEGKVALPAHGDPIVEPSRLFRAYIAHRAMREEWVRKAAVEHGGTLEELVPVAYADTRPELHPIAKLSLEAHLLKLLTEGLVSRTDGRYGPPT